MLSQHAQFAKPSLNLVKSNLFSSFGDHTAKAELKSVGQKLISLLQVLILAIHFQAETLLPVFIVAHYLIALLNVNIFQLLLDVRLLVEIEQDKWTVRGRIRVCVIRWLPAKDDSVLENKIKLIFMSKETLETVLQIMSFAVFVSVVAKIATYGRRSNAQHYR